MADKHKTEAHTDNGPSPSVLSGRLDHPISGDRRVPQLRKSLKVWIWHHGKRKDVNKKILNCMRKLIKNK
jgi:hypothetical protein